MARSLVVLSLLLAASPAIAQPISFKLRNDVYAGETPAMTVQAMEDVAGILLELSRSDGKSFTVKHVGLRRGGIAALPVGDGTPGRFAFQGKISLKNRDGDPWSHNLEFEAQVRAPMTVTYDFAHLDLEKREMKFQMSQPAGRADLVIVGASGKPIGSGAAAYDREPPGTWLSIDWRQKDEDVVMMHLKVTSADGIMTRVELIPWTLTIGHKDVGFDTDKSEIRPDETGKLDASLDQIRKAVKRVEGMIRARLYVAGHTDTVGTPEHNRQLSLDRARAIASYFRQKGLRIPISYEGFGEDALKVKTPDNTDEPQNRRADYVLGGDGMPPPRSLPRPASWKPLN